MSIEKLGLDESFAKLDSKEFKAVEIGYLESIKLPSLKQLIGLNLNDTEVSKLSELVESYKRVNARNSAVFAAHVRQLIKSRS